MPTYTRLVLQMDYNSKRSGEPDSWSWLDSPFVLRGSPEEQIEQAKAHVARRGDNKFVRGWRIVERTTVETDVVLIPVLTTGKEEVNLVNTFRMTLGEALRSPQTSIADLEEIEGEATGRPAVAKAARREIERRAEKRS